MKLYVVRHGQSEANVQGIYAGQAEYPLTEVGIEQAKNCGRLIQGLSFDRVYTSTLSRAIDTAKNALPGCVFEKDADLLEVSVGKLVGKNHRWCAENMGDEFLRFRDNWDFTHYGGENMDMVVARARRFLNKVAERGEEKAIAFCHAGMCAGLLMAVLNVKFERYLVNSDNVGITVFEYVGGRWTLYRWNVGERI